MNGGHDLPRLLAEFRRKAEPLGVTVVRVESVREAAGAISEWALAHGIQQAVVATELRLQAPGLWDDLGEAGLQLAAPGSADAIRDAPLGLSLGRLAVAETGSVLVAEESLEDRAIGMLSLAQAILCPTRRLVASLDDAAPQLRAVALGPGASFATLVTGPSRTADIERVLTVGVQGPGKVMTLFVDAL